MSKEELELKNIEFKNRKFNSKFIREKVIWYDIAIQINSYNGKKQEYWIRVMDLYNQKYRA